MVSGVILSDKYIWSHSTRTLLVKLSESLFDNILSLFAHLSSDDSQKFVTLDCTVVINVKNSEQVLCVQVVKAYFQLLTSLCKLSHGQGAGPITVKVFETRLQLNKRLSSSFQKSLSERFNKV